MPNSRGRTLAVVFALTAAFLLGAIDQYMGARNDMFLTQVSKGMSALWLVAPFIAAMWSLNRRSAMLIGLGAAWLSVLAYVLMILSPMEGTHWGPAPSGLHGTWNQLTLVGSLHTLLSQWQWWVLGALAGPVFGLLGFLWRSNRCQVYGLPIAIAIMMEPPARWAATRVGLGDVPWLPFAWPTSALARRAEIAEFAVGLVVTLMMIQFGAPRRGRMRGQSTF
jgi:hypothetical protein